MLKRQGDPVERKKIHDNLARIAALKAEFGSCKTKLKSAEDIRDHETDKLKHANEILLQNRDQLSVVEEEIDCDPLPEGAQPKSRLQKREFLRMVINPFYSCFIILHVNVRCLCTYFSKYCNWKLQRWLKEISLKLLWKP